jgi:hypothetical protein
LVQVQAYPPSTNFYGLTKIPLKLVFEAYMRMCNNSRPVAELEKDTVCDGRCPPPTPPRARPLGALSVLPSGGRFALEEPLSGGGGY